MLRLMVRTEAKLSRKRSDQRSSVSTAARRAGRPRVHSYEASIAILRYVDDQQKRTGLSISKILKHGVFYQVVSGSPETGSDGPHHPEVIHALRGAALRRRYFEAKAWLKQRTASVDRDGGEPKWLIGWVKLY